MHDYARNRWSVYVLHCTVQQRHGLAVKYHWQLGFSRSVVTGLACWLWPPTTRSIEHVINQPTTGEEDGQIKDDDMDGTTRTTTYVFDVMFNMYVCMPLYCSCYNHNTNPPEASAGGNFACRRPQALPLAVLPAGPTSAG